jgi:type IV pilus assembly protein PilY1
MKILNKSSLIASVVFAAASFVSVQSPTAAALTISQSPLAVSANVSPQVMIDLTKDNQLHFKAFSDYSDLDGDGVAETTYKHSIDYYGYFDSYKCYTYDAANGRFIAATTGTGGNTLLGPADPVNLAAKYCAANTAWSGNFLNWASMARIDAVRKILYGGYRSTDGAGAMGVTVLERGFIPGDAHSWVKFYDGTDVNRLTPFSPSSTPATGASVTSRAIGVPAAVPPAVQATSVTLTFNTAMTGLAIGDQVKVESVADPANYMIGGVTAVAVGSFDLFVEPQGFFGAGTFANWRITNLSSTGISICNTTPGAAGVASQTLSTVTYPPMMRVAKGNFSLWAANERRQCRWFEENNNLQAGFPGGFRSNGNRAAVLGINASAENPSRAFHAFTNTSTDLIARVEVCKPGYLGRERCNQYPNGNYKPVGLLQNYGETNLIQFGLMTGSYQKNVSGGVLRKNVSSFTDEVNVATDGTFKVPATLESIVQTLDRLRIYGYDYGDGTYIGQDGCTFQRVEILPVGADSNLNQVNQGNCSSWGNPMSEIYLESLRYLAGKTANTDFVVANAGTKDATLGLRTATWQDPINAQNFCAPLNVLLLNTSAPSYDDDQLGGISDLGAASTNKGLTKLVGDLEGITGKSFFVGNATAAGTTDNCTPKTVGDFGAVNGICPEGPSYNGSYNMAGSAWYSHTNKIRADIAVPAKPQFIKALKVDTYGIALSPTTPKIEIPVPDGSGRTVTLLPAYRLDLGGGRTGGGTIVDFKIVSQNFAAGTGRFYVNWEDSGFGGDFDQDVIGTLSYCIKAASTTCPNNPPDGTISVVTDVVAAATANGQGFGYIISGTTQDGVHFPSGIYGFNYPNPLPALVTPPAPNAGLGPVALDPQGVVGCNNCQISNAKVTWVYTLGATSGGVFKDPLYYAAKYGGYEAYNKTTGVALSPTDPVNWDQTLQDGSLGQDGIPDNFFFVTNPNALEKALGNALTKILASSSSSSAATNSNSLQANAVVYQARFKSDDWSGQLFSLNISTTGVINNATPNYDAAKVTTLQGPRNVLSFNPAVASGIAFNYGAMSAAQQAQLDINPVNGLPDGRGSLRVNYLKGDRSQEGFSAGNFRKRNADSVIGDIVNSSPQYVARPDSGFPDPSYDTYRNNSLSTTRTPVLYVGANDGMLHAFNVKEGSANAGTELFAYVPSMVYPNLSKLTANGYKHQYFVDGTPLIADVQIASTWKTYLVGGMGAGGKGYFALDVTDPDNFSASNIKWEFNATHDPNDLGVSIPQAKIAKMKNGKWVAIISNGYNSPSGKAVLYIAYLDGGAGNTWTFGTDIFKVVLDSGSGNGLSEAAVSIIGDDGTADYIYAGDLKGNMWRVDVTSATPATWTSGGSIVKIFQAKDALANLQPITSAPEVTRHPFGGYMVMFGTGQYLDAADTIAPFKTQSIYGVRDTNVNPALVSANLPPVLPETRANMGKVVFSTTAGVRNAVVNTTGANQSDIRKSWYGDLGEDPDAAQKALITGERVVFPPVLRGGRLFFSTLIPSSQACDAGGSSYFFGLAPFTGGPTPTQTFTSYQGVAFKEPGGNTFAGGTFIRDIGTSGLDNVILSGPTGLFSTKINPSGSNGRLSWRELLRDQ